MIHDKFSENYEILKAFAREAPEEPGVYIWKDAENRIIYVGKARVLKNRLVSYFSGFKDVKTAALMKHAKSIETIIVSNEYEALLLENTLIKQHSPKYNINLKDGKSYPVVRISGGAFPRVFRTRHIVEDGSLYFGPYPNVQALDKTLGTIEKLFPLRKCKTLKKRNNPCLYFHLKRCLAPCCGKVEEAAYNTQVNRVKKLLAGETEALTAELNAHMRQAAEALKFEEAADLRNAIRAIESLSENNSVADMDPEDRDYISWAAEGIFTCFSVFSIREGRMTSRELFNSRSAAGENETLETFIAAYYSPDRPPPPKIYLETAAITAAVPAAAVPADAETRPDAEASGKEPAPLSLEALSSFFSGQFGLNPELISPEREDAGAKKHIAALAMAKQNALEELRRRLRERGAGPALDELANVLKLKIRPERIEGFDIAQLDGKHPVASLISFKNGVPDRKNYRHFKLKIVVGKVDDFASMREAVHRRYSRLIKEGAELPDLLLVDGGLGQVNAACGALGELGLSCYVAGLAKRDEEIWLPGVSEPIRLSRRSEALKVLQHVRDESHRFATGLNQRLRSKDLYFSTLESLEGIGPKRAALIMKTYGDLAKVAAADPAEMAEKCGITKTAAKAVKAAIINNLEDRETRKRKPGREGLAAALAEASLAEVSLAPAGEAFAAEDAPDYEPT